MKVTSKIYLFITSLFFLFSPFSFGIVIIYFEDTILLEHIGGLIVNSVLLLILGITILILIADNRLSSPTKLEVKFLIFGFLSNIAIYFYTFQYSLNIENYMTTYFTVILILFLYLLIIDKSNLNHELWIIAIVFFVADLIHFSYISSHSEILETDFIDANFIQRIFYYSLPITTLALFLRKIKKYDVMDYFSYAFLALTGLILIVFVKGIDDESKFILTLNLLLPFVIITDFVVSIIFKRFNLYKLTFYIRMVTVVVLIFIYKGTNYFVMDSYSSHNLMELVMITYVVIICNFIEYLIPKKNKKNSTIN